MKALIVDDDRVLADVLAFTMRKEGYDIIMAHDGKTALQRWKKDNPDLIILDVNMPKLDGFSVCRCIRKESDVPIILLTVRGEEDDIVEGLEIGADDYIVKPFSPRQLVARTQAVVRRAGQTVDPQIHTLGKITYDHKGREIHVEGRERISLTPLENRLFHYLIINAGQVMTTDAIIDQVWGPMGGDRDMLRQLIHRLRSKVEEDSSQPEYIQTISGLGYGLKLDRKNA